MYYIQFIRPKPGVSEERLQEVLAATGNEWEKAYPEDEQVLFLKRLWRLGEYEYIKIWRIQDMARLDEWSSLSATDAEAAEHVHSWLEVVDDLGGVYVDA
jgi:hypothetical protein